MLRTALISAASKCQQGGGIDEQPLEDKIVLGVEKRHWQQSNGGKDVNGIIPYSIAKGNVSVRPIDEARKKRIYRNSLQG